MAAEEEVTDILWEEMKTLAMEQQQCLYELLPDYIEYKSDERKYLKQNIGYALFGPPKSSKDASATESKDASATESKDASATESKDASATESKDASTTESNSCYYKTENLNDTDVADTDVTDTVNYEKNADKTIVKIYDKICECAKTDDSQPIYFGTIYNMIFRPKMNEKPKKKEKTKETKTEEKETKEDEKELLIVSSVPIFKIKKSIQKKSETKDAKQEDTALLFNSTVEIQYETWYIDSNARVYKSWTDYKENNNLPQCTMVLPKDGVYLPDLTYPVTEDYSTVCLEILESPACTLKAKLFTGMDIASNVLGFGTVGLSVVSLFTPLAPVVAVSGLVAAGVTGAWSLGRNSQQLIDRSIHEESIHILDREALPNYLGIAGTAFGLGVIGGSVIISNVAARGMTVNTIARVAFNTVQGGNILINGIGVIYQGYNMIDKYKTEKTVTVGDALNLATHLMFFCGSVIKVQFASDIIESTQGRIMTDYKESLSTRRLRKNFNRAVKRAAKNNVCKMSENAEVIRHIRNRQDLLSNQPVNNSSNQIDKTKTKNKISKSLNQTSKSLNQTSSNIVWSFEHGRLKVNDILLLDPIEYVTRLINLGIFIEIDQNSSSGSRNYANDSATDQLLKVLCDLLSKFYVSNDCPTTKIPIVPDFEPLIREMSSMNINEDYLMKMFEIAIRLMKRSKDMDDFLLQIITFVWQFCKENLKQWGMSLRYCTQSVSSNKILKKIIEAVFEAIDMVLGNLTNAFMKYIHFSLHRITV